MMKMARGPSSIDTECVAALARR